MSLVDKIIINKPNTQDPPVKKTEKPRLLDTISQAADFESTAASRGKSATGFIRPVGNFGMGDSKYDYRVPEAEAQNINMIRAIRQPGVHQMANALAGGVMSGILTAIEDVSYILDIPNNIGRSTMLGMLEKTEEVQSNFIADWAKENKDRINEILPIYRTNPDQMFDWKNSGFYWEMTKGILDSAIGFGAVGMGAAALVKGAGSAMRAGARVGRVNRLKAWTDMAGKGLQQGVGGNISAAYVTNFGEGKLMALELFEMASEKTLEQLVKQHEKIYGIAPNERELEGYQIEASDIAGKQADDFMMRNKLFMMTDYLQLNSIFRTQSLTRDLLSKPGFMSWAKTQLKTAPKEAMEEIGQNIFQMEGQYQADKTLKDMGIEVDDMISQETDWVDRFIDFGLSEQALLEGLMGLISGPVQYAITTAPFQNTEQREKAYNDQQATIAKNKEFFQAKTNLISEKTKGIQDAVQKNQMEVAELMEVSAFEELVVENFARGTTENLHSMLNQASKSNEYTSEEQGAIKNKIDRLLEMENEYSSSYRKYSDAVSVFNNRIKRGQLKKAQELLDKQKSMLASNILEDFDNEVRMYNRLAKPENRITTADILNGINNKNISNFTDKLQTKIRKNPNVQKYSFTNFKNIPVIERAINNQDEEYSDMVKTNYQLGFERFNDIVNDETSTTEEKSNLLSQLENDVKSLDNKVLKDKIKSTKATLDEYIRKGKEANQTKEEPEIQQAKVKKKATEKPVVEEAKVLENEEPNSKKDAKQDQQENEDLRKGLATKAMMEKDWDRVNEVNNLSQEELNQLHSNEENINEARQAQEEWNNLSPEQKEEILTSTPVQESIGDTDTFTPVEQLFDDEVNNNENPKSTEVEARAYNNVTGQINSQLSETTGQDDVTKGQLHPKLIMPPNRRGDNNEAFLRWAEQGVSHEGDPVTLTLSNWRGTPEASKALDTFNKVKRGEEVSKQDKLFMIDNLPIRVAIDNVPNASTFLYTVRDTSDNKAAVKQERKLRTQVIANLLQDQPAKSTIQGQYGGDLTITQENVSIMEIPDFKNNKAEDIPLLYVNSEGYLFDVETRELTRNAKFQNTKVVLKGKNKPMAGAVFTTVRKANGELFPLKLNIKPFSQNEKELIVSLLKNIITKDNDSQINRLNTPVPQNLINLMDQADADYLSKNGSKNIMYKDALNYFVYEGDRSTTNPITQLLFKKGKVIFGDQEISLDDWATKQGKLMEFLDKYKNRNVDLRKMKDDKAYKRHIISNGILETNTDTSGETLFYAANLMEKYPNKMEGGPQEAVKQRTINRYRSAAVYINSDLTNKVSTQREEASKPLESTEKTSKLPDITDTPQSNKFVSKLSNKIMNKIDNKTLPDKGSSVKPIDTEKSRTRAINLANRFNKKVQNVKKDNDKNKKCPPSE